jgi:hypothetical protein
LRREPLCGLTLLTEPDSYDALTDPQHLESPPAAFVVAQGHRTATLGEAMRQLEGSAPLLKTSPGAEMDAKPAGPKFEGGYGNQQQQTQSAHDDAYNLVAAALSALADVARGDHRARLAYEDWFGAHTTERFDTVRDAYQEIKTAMEETTFTYNLTGSACHPSWSSAALHDHLDLQRVLVRLRDGHRLERRYHRKRTVPGLRGNV